jgi:hypothetical protein
MSIVLSTTAITQGRSTLQSACQSISLSTTQSVYLPKSGAVNGSRQQQQKNTYTFPHINQTEFSAYQIETTTAISCCH